MRADRVVADSNLLIGAVLRPQGPPRAAIDAVRLENGVLLFTEGTPMELRARILRRKFDRYVGRDVRTAWVARLEAVSEWTPVFGARLGCRDPDDDKLLETALMGDAGCLITGDRDLLAMSPFCGIPVLTPAAFLDSVKSL